MVSRSGGTSIKNLNKVKPGYDQAFTLPKGASAAPIKNVPVKAKVKAKTKTETKTKSEPKKIKAKIKPKPKADSRSIPKKLITKTKTKTKKNPNPKKRKKKIGWSKPAAFTAGVGTAGTAAALVAMGRSKDKYRKYRK